MYNIGFILGFILIPALFFVIAILIAKKKAWISWILFAVGCLLMIMSMLGRGKELQYANTAVQGAAQSQNTLIWIIFAVLAVISIILILKRSSD